MQGPDTVTADGEGSGQPAESAGAMVRVPIQSKLGLGPSDPHPAKTILEQVPTRRARSHRRQP